MIAGIEDDALVKLTPRLQRLILYTVQRAFSHDDEGESRLAGGLSATTEDWFYLIEMAIKAEQSEQQTKGPLTKEGI